MSLSCDILVVGGGASGGSNAGAGGGAGGVHNYVNQSLTIDTGYAVTVGAAGAGVTDADGNYGGDSVFAGTSTLTGGGGGRGARYATGTGGNGGSGGGGAGTGAGASAGGTANGNGTGNNGGNGDMVTSRAQGGGGGYGAAGSNGNGTTQVGGNGGTGLTLDSDTASLSSFSGMTTVAAGAGGSALVTKGTGATGAGDGNTSSGTAGAGTSFGSGGGGDWTGTSGSGAGKAGVVVVRYTGAQQATGGNSITTVNGKTYHVFTSNGTFTPIQSVTPSVGALTLTGNAPSIINAVLLTPAVGSLALTGVAPVISLDTKLTPAVGSLALTGVAPVVAQSIVLTPSTGSLTLTGIAPGVSRLITPGTGALTFNGNPAEFPPVITPGAGSLTLTGATARLNDRTVAVTNFRQFSDGLWLEKEKRSWAPAWVLVIRFATGTLYLSDDQFTITGWPAEGTQTTKGWVKQWGYVDSVVASELGAATASDFTCVLFDDQSNPNRWSNLVEHPSNAPATTSCELYLWGIGLDASLYPPFKVWQGTIRDPGQPDTDQSQQVIFMDESVGKLNPMLGTAISTALFANADAAALGKIVPLPIGSVTQAPALPVNAGAHNSVALDAAVGATTLYASNTNEQPAFGASGTLIIDGRNVAYSAKSTGSSGGVTYRTFAVTALSYPISRGALILESKAQYDYAIAPYDVKQLDYSYADMVRIAGTLVSSGGYNYLRFTTHPLYLKLAALAASGASGLSDSIGVSNAAGTQGNISAASQVPSSWTRTTLSIGGPGNASGYPQTITVASFSNVTGMTKANYSLGASAFTVTFIGACSIYLKSNTTTVTIWQSSDNNTPASIDCNIPDTGDTLTLGITGDANSVAQVKFDLSCSRIPFTTGTADTASKTGTVTLTGGAATVIGTGLTERDLLDLKVTWDGGGAKDDGSGTYTGSASALIERPDHVYKWVLNTYASRAVGSISTASEFGTATGNYYKLSHVVQDKIELKEFLQKLAWQSRCYNYQAAGVSKLIWRPSTITALKTVTDADVRRELASNVTSLKRGRTNLADVINVVEVLFDLDPSGILGWRQTTKSSDATSITAYGRREKPEHFGFDMVSDATMAADVRDFYLARYKDQHKMAVWESFLNQAEIDFAAKIALMHPLLYGGLLTGETTKANLTPGTGKQPDRIELTLTGA